MYQALIVGVGISLEQIVTLHWEGMGSYCSSDNKELNVVVRTMGNVLHIGSPRVHVVAQRF